MTQTVSKQLLPVYDKPVLYYPLSALMQAGIREILIISTPRDLPKIQELLGDGSNLGVNLSYLPQPKPNGIAQALILGEAFLNHQPSCLILGDNIFYGQNLPAQLERSAQLTNGAQIYAYQVQDPERYGVLVFSAEGKPSSIIEKPNPAPSPWAVTGLYFYDQNAPRYAKTLAPSARGELEISDLNRIYLEKGQLEAHRLSVGTAWLDCGTFDSLLSASLFVQTLEQRQGLKVACLEEIAWTRGWISSHQLGKTAESYGNSPYGLYLQKLLRSHLAAEKK